MRCSLSSLHSPKFDLASFAFFPFILFPAQSTSRHYSPNDGVIHSSISVYNCCTSMHCLCPTKTFSILTRIDAPVTCQALAKQSCPVDNFQYPHTDRCPCNTKASDQAVTYLLSFSILTRIDAPVTRHQTHTPRRRVVPFSILTRIDAPVTR